VDPIEGGSANGYEYCSGDGINCLDLDGNKFAWKKWVKRALKATSIVGGVALLIGTGGTAGIALGLVGALADVGLAAIDCAGLKKMNPACQAGLTVVGLNALTLGTGKYFRSAMGVARWGLKGAARMARLMDFGLGVSTAFGPPIGQAIAEEERQ
jgi:hypothetical protein